VRQLGKKGRPKKGEGKGDNDVTFSGRGNSAIYTLARLDRDRPDLAAQVRSGRLSANAAAIEAGFRKKPPSPSSLYLYTKPKRRNDRRPVRSKAAKPLAVDGPRNRIA
jgi:hypothetical protein